MRIKLSLLGLVALVALVPLAAQPAGMGFGSYGDKQGSLGLGYGIPYGGLGLNADYLFLDNVALTVGFGAFEYSAGYSIGAKVFFRSPERALRPQLLMVYGVNGIITKDAVVEVTSNLAYTGVTAGLGAQYMLGKSKKHGFDADLIYVLSSGVFKACDDYNLPRPGRLAFSFGYRYAFTLKM